MRFIKPVKGGGGVDTSDATAISDNILMDRTAYARGEKLVGTMGLHEDAEETTIQPGESFQIIGGYHTGGVVKAPTLASMTADATAAAGDIASKKTAYVNGVKVTGTGKMDTMNTVQSITPASNDGGTITLEILSKENYIRLTSKTGEIFITPIKAIMSSSSLNTTAIFYSTYSTGYIITIARSTSSVLSVNCTSKGVYNMLSSIEEITL